MQINCTDEPTCAVADRKAGLVGCVWPCLRLALLLTLVSIGTSVAALPTSPELPTRCAWFDNPTPGNATLGDRDEDWIIGMQGALQR